MRITINDKNKKIFKKSIIIITIILFVFIIAMIMLKYEIEGENKKYLPFNITSITVASTVDAIRNEDENYLWNVDLLKINDIYINIEKNTEEEKNIKSVKIQDIIITKKIGEHKTTKIIKNNYSSENIETFEFVGENNTSLEKLTISKQGGIIGFRHIIQELGNYTTNNKEVTYNNELLEKLEITKEMLETKLQFNIIIELDNSIKYKTEIEIDLPTDENVKNIDISKIIFKRILQN